MILKINFFLYLPYNKNLKSIHVYGRIYADNLYQPYQGISVNNGKKCFLIKNKKPLLVNVGYSPKPSNGFNGWFKK